MTLGDSLSPRWGWDIVEPGGAFDLRTNGALLNMMSKQWCPFWSWVFGPLPLVLYIPSSLAHMARQKREDEWLTQNTSLFWYKIHYWLVDDSHENGFKNV